MCYGIFLKEFLIHKIQFSKIHLCTGIFFSIHSLNFLKYTEIFFKSFLVHSLNFLKDICVPEYLKKDFWNTKFHFLKYVCVPKNFFKKVCQYRKFKFSEIQIFQKKNSCFPKFKLYLIECKFFIKENRKNKIDNIYKICDRNINVGYKV